MRQVMRKGLITVAAASGVLAATGGYAHADAGAQGAAVGSPGVLSGNTVQAPVHVPVNVCGNTVNVVGALNPAMGNKCVNASGGGHHGGGHHGGGHGAGSSHGSGGAHAGGATSNSPGVGSGNTVQVPIDIPVNACGNSVDVVGVGNPAFGNGCGNESEGPSKPPTGEKPPTKPENPGNPGNPEEPNNPGNPGNPEEPKTPETPGKPNEPKTPHEQDAPKPRPAAHVVDAPKSTEALAETGSSLPLGVILPAGAGMLLAGAILYRRNRAAA
ncbi:chaplin [Streptomyces tsukubensis]|uniref:DUF320 domain-containing protein n=1 Tax=Streptomyces tsukubensis TaxID=83656 RepID=A0A1V4AF77_9ACTN|nr:chaplin [Streptomyces tsukubensis]OON82296.1 hypothetical protein B1H18_04485 [Streptomyces tsukubensis]QFR92785.1 DUF320 domain-containing protein [Streptomyces tsukubensis]